MKINNVFISLLLVISGVFSQNHEPQLHIEFESELFHKPILILATGLPPKEKIQFNLKVIDAKKHKWYSKAIYIADSKGTINFSNAPSVGGDYLGIQPMGLFWSMKSNDYHQIATNSGFKATISVSINSKILVEQTIYRKSTRELQDLKVTYQQKRDSLIADLYIPNSKKKLPAIIFLGGSGGGFRQERASLYASAGYAVLDLKYFKYEPLPDGIIEIPLEYVEKAFKWLIQQPEIDPQKIGIIGRSRGSELAMLYASNFGGLKFVIAQVPSCVVWFGWADNKSSWSYKNKPIEYSEYTDRDSEHIENEFIKKGVQYRDGPKFLSAFTNKIINPNSIIKVEDIGCPILFISGKDDQVWPSTMMSNMMIKRLQNSKFEYEFKHLAYDNAGHNFAGGGQGCGIPYLPPEDYSKGRSAKGGTDAGNAKASIDSWLQILKFIERQIK